MDKQTNILIAEDEASIALALKKIVCQTSNNTKVTVVSNVPAALETLANNNYDLLISGWNMPHMTGLELLSKVRKNQITEKLPFLMLSARTDAVSVKSALELGVSGYISKPFNQAKLIQKVNKLLSPQTNTTVVDHHGLIENIAAKLKKGDIAFPMLPEMALKAVEVIDSKDASLEDVAALINADAGLTSKIISLANSSYYRAVKPIQELKYAIGRIGLRDSANLILMHTTSGVFHTKNPLFKERQHHLWEQSLATACSARLIGKRVEHPQPERLYAIGMLNNIGKMLLLQVLAELATVRDDVTEQSIDDTIENLHIAFGVALLKRWKFPSNFIEAVQYHPNQGQLDKCSLDTQIVSYASLIVSHMDMYLHEAEKDAEVLEELGKLLGITLEQADFIRQETIDYVDEMKSVN